VKLAARVPATSANLGPGFDCFALALELHNEVIVDTDAEPLVVWEGEGAAELPVDGSDLISRSMLHIARAAGRELPPFAVRGVNRIPLERGLGSSAAAVVAGVTLADRLLELGMPEEDRLGAAVEIEGHPDNVAGALLGGLVLAFRADGAWRAERLAPSPALRPVALVPEELRLSTSQARSVLPKEVPLADAAHNSGRAALAVLALTERPELLPVALEDRLHQPARLALVPAVNEVFRRLRASGIPVCVSGAGPSLLAFDRDGADVPDPGPGWRVIRAAPSGEGTVVTVG